VIRLPVPPNRRLLAALVCAALGAAGCGEARRDAPPGTGAAPAAPKEPAAPALSPADAPRLVFREESISFGTKFDDETADVTVAFRNAGGRTLHVNRVDVDCACARLDETPREVAPGATAELRLRLKFVGVSGPIRHRVAIDCDDPATPIARAWMTGEIRPRLAVEPRKVELRPAALADAASADLAVRGFDGGRLADLTATTTSRELTVAVTPTETGARVRIAAAPFADDFIASVVLRNGRYEKVVPVRAFAALDVRAVPNEVTAGFLRRGEPIVLKLVGRKGVTWRVLSVESDRADLSGEVEGDVLRIRVGEKAPAGAFSGAVVVVLEGANPSRVRIPVRAVVRE
jgi:uncharacterized protein DUF1573